MTALLENLSTSECFIKENIVKHVVFTLKNWSGASMVQGKSHECSVVYMQMYVCYIRVIIHKQFI